MVDQGSIFTVTVPRGASHVPPGRIAIPDALAAMALHSNAYVEAVADGTAALAAAYDPRPTSFLPISWCHNWMASGSSRRCGANHAGGQSSCAQLDALCRLAYHPFRDILIQGYLYASPDEVVGLPGGARTVARTRSRSQPGLDVRPGALLGAAASHDPDVAAMHLKHLLVFTTDLVHHSF